MGTFKEVPQGYVNMTDRAWDMLGLGIPRDVEVQKGVTTNEIVQMLVNCTLNSTLEYENPFDTVKDYLTKWSSTYKTLQITPTPPLVQYLINLVSLTKSQRHFHQDRFNNSGSLGEPWRSPPKETTFEAMQKGYTAPAPKRGPKL